MDEPTPAEHADGQKRSLPRRTVLIGLVVVVAIVAVIPLVVAFTPRINVLWPYGRPYYESWARDRHRATASTCLHCHVEPGLRGIVTYPITFWGGLLSDVSGGAVERPSTTVPSDRVCMRSGCHTTNRLTSPSGDLRVDHGAHAEEGIRCIACHPGAGHDGAGGRYMRPPMEACAECHEEQMGDCRYCHVGRSLPAESGTP